MRISDEKLAAENFEVYQGCLADLIADLREAREQLTQLGKVFSAVNAYFASEEQIADYNRQNEQRGGRLGSYSPPPLYEKAALRKTAEQVRAYFTAKDAAPKGDRS